MRFSSRSFLSFSALKHFSTLMHFSTLQHFSTLKFLSFSALKRFSALKFLAFRFFSSSAFFLCFYCFALYFASSLSLPLVIFPSLLSPPFTFTFHLLPIFLLCFLLLLNIKLVHLFHPLILQFTSNLLHLAAERGVVKMANVSDFIAAVQSISTLIRSALFALINI